MFNVRCNIFETNSSSVHSLTMCSLEKYDAWKNGKLFYCHNTDTFYTDEERLQYMKAKKLVDHEFKSDWHTHTFTYKDQTYNIIDRYNIANTFIDDISDADAISYYDDCIESELFDVPVTFKQYIDYVNEFYETFSDSYTAKSGETVVAFGYYGHD